MALWGWRKLDDQSTSLAALIRALNQRFLALAAFLRLAATTIYNPADWGVTFDGVTNDTAAWLAFVAMLPVSGFVIDMPNRGTPSMIDATNPLGIAFSGKRNFKIRGNGATIKVLSGAPIVGNYDLMSFTDCLDGSIENLIQDGNRAGRNPTVEAGAYNNRISTGCARLYFKNVRSINAVCDAFTFVSGTPGVLASYPTDVVLEECTADGSFRNGLSPINSNRCKVIGGRYVNTVGIAPQAGIDAEPDGTSTFGNVDLLIDGAEVSGNAGVGLAFAGGAATPNTRPVVRNLKGSNNAGGLLQLVNAVDLTVDGVACGPHSAATRGIIDVGSPAAGVINAHLSNIDMAGITAALPANACLYIHAAVSKAVALDNIHLRDIACAALVAAKTVKVNILTIDGCTADPAVTVTASAPRSVLRGVESDSCRGAVLWLDAADLTVDGVKIVDYGTVAAVAAIQFEAGAVDSICRNVDVLQTVSKPAGSSALRYNGVRPKVLRNVTAKSAGVDFTAADIVSFLAGTAGSQISDLVPDPFRAVAAFTPGTIAAGTGVTSAAIPVPGAAFGDPVWVSAPYDPQEATVTAYVSSAGNVMIRVYNGTAFPITLALGNWTVWLEKR
jgi:hypothetical protein